MIHFIEGNLLESKAEALVNTVNTVGVMGKGIALQFKTQFPHNYGLYRTACKAGEVQVGKMFVTKEGSLLEEPQFIINFPTKTDWRKPSEYSYVEEGLKDLLHVIEHYQIKSIAIPPLGAGNGGLDWSVVKNMIVQAFSGVDCEVLIYEPNANIRDIMRKERVALTPARAMLLSVLYEFAGYGEFVSEFAAEKVAYFLQRFGAEDQFRLQFNPYFYGPYSGKVRHVLHYLNGSYITGYNDKDKKPFDFIDMVPEAKATIETYLEQEPNREFKQISENTKTLLAGFYSEYGLELLSTVDFIMQHYQAATVDEIITQLSLWNNRKKTMFTKPEFVAIALERLQKTNFTTSHP